MVPLKQFIRNVMQRLGGTFYEGPDAPQRIADAVRHFASHKVYVSHDEWLYFATLHAQECYKTGYIRGLEWAERDLDRRDPTTDPDVLLANAEHNWGMQEDSIEIEKNDEDEI